MKRMQVAHVSTITDQHAYMMDVRTDEVQIIIEAGQGEGTQQLIIDPAVLSDTIRVLSAIHNCNELGLGIRPLFRVIDGEYTGCLCMELIRTSDDGVHRMVHIVETSESLECRGMEGQQVFLARAQYQPFAPSKHDNPERMDYTHEKGTVKRAVEPVLPSYLKEN